MALDITPVKRRGSDPIVPLQSLIHPDDLAATFRGLHGRYLPADVHRRYVSVCRETGRPAATLQRLARTVSQRDDVRVVRSNGHRLWEFDAASSGDRGAGSGDRGANSGD